MKHLPLLLGTFLVLAAALHVRAAKIGDPAGALAIQDWVRGEPVALSAGKGKQTYVVEFWATWCGPCRTTIPHLSELQKKFKDRNVTFIGVSDEPVAKVKPFVEKMGAKMEYTVASDPSRKTHQAYMEAYGQNGIPAAFVVDPQGRIAWVGHPMAGLEEVLEKVVAGRHDLEAAQKEFAEQAAMAEKQAELSRTFSTYAEALAAKDAAKARDTGTRLLELAGQNANVLNSIAWTLLTNPRIENRDLDFALRVAQAAAAANPKNPAILDTLARAHFDKGQWAEAVAQQKKAVALAGDNAEARTELARTLERYEARSKEAKEAK